MIVRLAPVFPSHNALSKAQLASSSSGLTPQDRTKSPKIGDTESISLPAQTETLTTLLELQAAIHQLSAPAMLLPTPRATR
jgi:hypothetical protein